MKGECVRDDWEYAVCRYIVEYEILNGDQHLCVTRPDALHAIYSIHSCNSYGETHLRSALREPRGKSMYMWRQGFELRWSGATSEIGSPIQASIDAW